MKLSVLMAIKSIICILFGLSFLLVPELIMSIYGVTLDASGTVMARFLGATFVILSITLWFGRNDSGSETLRGFVLGIFIGDSIGFVVALIAQLSGIMNVLGWAIVALWFLLAAGFGYFQFTLPRKA